MQENQELKKLVEFYERANGRNPELSEAVEWEKMRNEIRRKKDHEIAVWLITAKTATQSGYSECLKSSW